RDGPQMPVVAAPFLPRRQLPEADRAIPTARSQHPAVRREGNCPNASLMAEQARSKRAFGGVPQADGLVLSGGRQQGAVGRESQSCYPVAAILRTRFMSGPFAKLVAIRAPKADGLEPLALLVDFDTSGGQHLAVRRPCQAGHSHAKGRLDTAA